MNKRLTWFLSAAMLGAVSMAAVSANASMDKHAEHRSQHMRNGSQDTADQLAKLESALKLQDAQRPAWNAFAQQMKNLAQAREQQHKAQHADKRKSTTATEHMETMGQMMQSHQDQLAKMKAATQTLMTELSPSQQTVLNEKLVDVMPHGASKLRGSSKDKAEHGHCKS